MKVIVKNNALMKIIVVIFWLTIGLVSYFKLADITSSPNTYKETIKRLDDKKVTVLEITSSSAVVSTALTVCPNDISTPLADQLVKITKYFLIVLSAIYLEKMLLLLVGMIVFKFIVPIACVLFIINIILKNIKIKELAQKIFIFGLIVYTIMPFSLYISTWVEQKNEEFIQQTIDSTRDIQNKIVSEVESENNEDTGFIESIKNKAQEVVETVTVGVKVIIEECKMVLSNLIDVVAIFIVTTCVIPIVIILLYIRMVKVLFESLFPKTMILNKSKIPGLDFSKSRKLCKKNEAQDL